jgi:hypothetical protein
MNRSRVKKQWVGLVEAKLELVKVSGEVAE